MGLTIEATEDTPFINLDENGRILFEGRSLPENVTLFYKPVFEWIDDYVNNPANNTYVRIFLNYYNSSSFKCISDILYKLKKIYTKENLKVEWVYEEDDQSIFETGEELKSELNIPFDLISKPVIKEKKQKMSVTNKKTGKTYQITKEYWNLIVKNGHEKDFDIIENQS